MTTSEQPGRPLSVPIDAMADDLVNRFGVSPSLDAHVGEILRLGELARNFEDVVFRLIEDAAQAEQEAYDCCASTPWEPWMESDELKAARRLMGQPVAEVPEEDEDDDR